MWQQVATILNLGTDKSVPYDENRSHPVGNAFMHSTTCRLLRRTVEDAGPYKRSIPNRSHPVGNAFMHSTTHRLLRRTVEDAGPYKKNAVGRIYWEDASELLCKPGVIQGRGIGNIL